MTGRGADQNHLNYCWIEVDGCVVHVSSYVGCPRPEARCPVCGAAAVLHLGGRRAHHYQHKGGVSGCPLSDGETAKHFNAKHHVAEQLRAAASLQASGRCPGDGDDTGCPHWYKWLFAQSWRAVKVESTVGSLRPDVLVIGEAGPTAAIEILVKHSVTQHKGALLAELKIPWIEVAADDALRWNSTQALPAVRSHLARGVWLCADHRNARDQRLRNEEALEEARRAAASREARERQEDNSRRARQRPLRYRAVDAVAGARRTRYVFRVTVQLNSVGTATEKAWLSCDQSSSFEVTDHAPERGRTLRAFATAVLRYMTELISYDHYQCLESPSADWQRLNDIEPAELLDVARYPPRYRWDDVQQAWTTISRSEEVA